MIFISCTRKYHFEFHTKSFYWYTNHYFPSYQLFKYDKIISILRFPNTITKKIIYINQYQGNRRCMWNNLYPKLSRMRVFHNNTINIEYLAYLRVNMILSWCFPLDRWLFQVNHKILQLFVSMTFPMHSKFGTSSGLRLSACDPWTTIYVHL